MYIRGFDDIGEGRTDVIFSKKNCLVQEVSTTHTHNVIYIYMYIIARAVYATRVRAYNISLHSILYTLSRRRTAGGGQKSEFYYSVDGDEGGLFFSFFFFF